ncbi:MAG: sporulation protein [Cytophagales bacterium CG18_big_fil_WC_8_21_14_2_50_42_9]|nr:MAG: sporulation protein [Cytophagales bacterium CG18_big_fil_WC_8_21_14_2_50_42_9]
MIQAHIHKLLFDHDCVIIPDFGGLITHYEAARIHPVKHAFLPPSKRVAFNEKLKINDGLLINTYGYDHHISSEEAQMQVAEFVRQLQEELFTTQRFELKGVGLFRLNQEQRIEFEYIQNDNFLSDSFGLPELMVRPIIAPDAAAGLRTLLKEKQNAAPVATGKPTLRRKIRRIYDRVAVLTITGLTISALYLISQRTDYNVSSLNPFALNSDADSPEKEVDNFTAPASVQTEEIPAFTPSETKDVVAELSEIEKILAEDKTTVPAGSEPVKAPDLNAAPNSVTPLVKEAEKEKIAKNEETAAFKKETKTSEVEKAAVNNADAATIKNSTGRYYVISGAYSSLKKANYYRRIHARHGVTGKIILPFGNNKLHRLSLTDFSTREEALQELPALRKKFGPDLWILNY